MTNLSIKEFNNQTIRIREDRYVCLTDMAKASGKLFGHWNELKTSKSYLEVLSESIGIPIDQLIQVNESKGSNDERGTWGHPKLAIRFAQWCSDSFAVQVDMWVDELMTTGKVELEKPEPIPLPPQDIRIKDLKDSLEFFQQFGIDLSNPRYAQHIKDIVVNTIIGVAALPEVKEVWVGVAEKAESMGYPTNIILKYRATLGKFVKAQANEYGIEQTQEVRICNGRNTTIQLYKDSKALAEVISEYMDAKVLKG